MTVVNVHTGEIVDAPTDALAMLDPGEIDAARDPGAFVVLACERAKTWLTEALTKGDIDSIVELKSQAEAIRVYTVQKQVGKDAQLAATEIVRRAERGLGLCIRRGQAEGKIRTREAALSMAPNHGHPDGASMASPSDYASYSELAGGGTVGIYGLTDDVSDEQFEAALTEAKAEGNLSRANVARKAKGEEPKPNGDRPELLRKTRRHDANRIVTEICHGLEGYVLGLSLIDFDQLDRAQIDAWSGSLSKSLQSLNRLNRQLKELDQA